MHTEVVQGGSVYGAVLSFYLFTVYLMMMSVALDYVALNDWITVNNKFEMMKKKVEWTNLRYYPGICL
jgi:tetrahydromethanopterin S-methyltransferase subunit G